MIGYIELVRPRNNSGDDEGMDATVRRRARSPSPITRRGNEVEEDRWWQRQIHHSGFIQHQYEYDADMGARRRARSPTVSPVRRDAPYWRGDRNRGAVDRYESGSSSGGGTNDCNKSCTVEFDGSSKGNPGQAGAGAVVRSADGSMVVLFRQGVGFATSNVAEYRGAILGLQYALELGFKHVRIQGDSLLVCRQVQGRWRTKSRNMYELCKEVKDLKCQFLSFQIHHVGREHNTEADALANLAAYLPDGEIEVEYV